jgi:copper transport protein
VTPPVPSRPAVRSRAILAIVAAAVVVACQFASVAPAGAHALRVSSTPDAGADLSTAPRSVTVTFGEPPDARLSRLRVLDSSGHDETSGPTTAVPGQPLALQVPLRPLGHGVYTVSWTTVSSVDGHLASGTFAFGVGVAPTGAASTARTTRTTADAPAALVGRWLLYAGLMVLVGGAVIALFCFVQPPRWSWPDLAWLAWSAAVVGAVTIAFADAAAAHVATSELWSSSFRLQLEYRLGPLLLGALLLIVPPLRRPRRALAVLGVAGLVAMWGDVRLSHAAAATRDAWLKSLEQWAHFAAAGTWIGGLVTLLLGLVALDPADRGRAARRFSNIALASVVVLVGSGVVRAIDEVGSWHALTSTTFGQAILVKAGLLALLIALGAWNRFRSVPKAGDAPRGLRRVGVVELGLVALVLVATAVLQGQAPPASVAAAAGPPPVVVSGHDFADTVAVRLTVAPGTAGFNRFEALVTDPDTGKRLRASVDLSFSLPARADLGTSTLALTRQPDGTYAASGANLSIDGAWDVTALVQQATSGSQVDLHLTTRPTPQQVTVERSPGIPDLYTITLPDATSLQVYLDPGRPGSNEFHATYVGADGKEMPMRSLQVTATGPGPQEPARPLPVRKLDTIGHFVADLSDARTGPHHFVLDAVGADGTPYRSTVTIPVR